MARTNPTPHSETPSRFALSPGRLFAACPSAYHSPAPLRRGAGSGQAVMTKLKSAHSYRKNASWSSRFVIMEALCRGLAGKRADAERGRSRPEGPSERP